MSEHFFRPETWKPLNEKILRVGTLAGSLLDFSAALQARSGLTLKEVLTEFPNFTPAVLGGVSRDGAYGESSLAAVFRGLFGASIDTRQYCALKAASDENAEANVTFQVNPGRVGQSPLNPGDFLALLRAARLLSEGALKAWEPRQSTQKLQEGGGDYLNQPAKAVEDIQALLQGIANLAPGVDERTTFLWMTRRITWRYLTATFPLAEKPEGIAFLQRLGLDKLWEPNPNPNGGYAVWGYPDYRPWSGENFRQGVDVRTYAGSILALNRLAHLVFGGERGEAYNWYKIASAIFASPPNLAQIFRERAQGQLTRVQRPADPFRDIRDRRYLEHGVKIKGPLAMPSELVREYREDPNKAVSVHALLDWLIPSVCYGETEIGIQHIPGGDTLFHIVNY